MNYHYYIGAYLKVPKSHVNRTDLEKIMDWAKDYDEDELFFATFENDDPDYHLLMSNKGYSPVKSLDPRQHTQTRYGRIDDGMEYIIRLKNFNENFLRKLSDKFGSDFVSFEYGFVTAYS